MLVFVVPSCSSKPSSTSLFNIFNAVTLDTPKNSIILQYLYAITYKKLIILILIYAITYKKRIFYILIIINIYVQETILKKEEIIKIEKARQLIIDLKEKYKLTYDLLFQNELKVPIDIFLKEITTLQSVVKYLKEDLELSLHEISLLLGRNEKSIWHIYNKANKLLKKKFLIKHSEYLIPVFIFRNNLSAQESLIVFLKEKLNLSYIHISRLIQRDQRIISTVYLRGKRKNV